MKIEKDLIQTLAACEVESNKLYIRLQLDRKTYEQLNKVLQAIGGKWKSNLKAHVFESDVEDVLQDIILTGEYENIKKDYQYFPTPAELAAEIVVRANIRSGDRCLEPSAGEGNIAFHLPENTHVIELNEKNRQKLIDKGFNLIHDDFMTFEPESEYDVIVMNPPFAKQQDIAHVTKAIRIAKRTVVAIMSQGVMWRTDSRSTSFRALVASYAGTVEELPANSFKESGTNINTCLVVVNKF